MVTKRRGAKADARTQTVVERIDAWSYSRWSKYDTCPFAALLSIVRKIPTDTSSAMERGKRIHDQAEMFLKDSMPLPDTKIWQRWGDNLRDLQDTGYVAEMNIAFSDTWEPCEYFGSDTWVRMRVDAYGHNPPVPGPEEIAEGALACQVEVIDYKTGKYNVSHGDQAELYGIAGLLLTPDADAVMVSYWYLDMSVEDGEQMYYFSREYDLDKLRDKWTKRANVMLTDTEFKPNPCKSSCGKYGGCDFAANKGGQCLYTTAGVLKAGAKKGDTPEPPRAKLSRFNRSAK